MKVGMFAYGFLGTDARIRKTIQWLTQSNHEVAVLNHFPDALNPGEATCSYVDTFDGAYLNTLWQTKAALSASAMLAGMRDSRYQRFVPEVIYCHELDTLSLYLAQWTPQTMDAVARGATWKEAGVSFAKPGKQFLIYDAHELEYDRRMVGLPQNIREDRAWKEAQCIGLVDQMIVVSEGIKMEVEAKYGISGVLTAPNSLPSPHRQLDRSALGTILNTPAPKVMFCGNLTTARRLGEVMEAVLDIGAKLVTIGRPIDAGTPIAPILSVLQQGGALMIPPQNYPYYGGDLRMLDLLSGGNVGVNGTDEGIRSYELSLPNKLFEYAAAGIPIVSSHHMEECGRLCAEYGIGSLYNNTADGLARELQFWIDNPPPPEAFKRFTKDWAFESTYGRTIDIAMRRAKEYEQNRKGGEQTRDACGCDSSCTKGRAGCCQG